MRFALLAAALALAACEEQRPAPLASERAAAACQRAGIAPGSPDYLECFTRTFDTIARADAGMARRPVMGATLPPAPQVQPVQMPAAAPRMQTTCMPMGGGMVSCF